MISKTNPIRAAFATLAMVIVSGAGCASQDGPLSRELEQELRRVDVAPPTSEGVSSERAEDTLTRESPSPERSMTLDELFTIADGNSPRLRAARARIGSAVGRGWQASRYPNPAVDVGGEEVPLRDSWNEGKYTVGLTQPIVLGSRLSAGKASARARVIAAQAELEVARREVHADIETLVASIASSHGAMEAHQELLSLLKQSSEMAEARHRAGAAPETDLIGPRIQTIRLQTELNELERLQNASLQQLGQVLGVSVSQPNILSVEPPDQSALPSIDELLELVRTQHPAMVSARAAVDEATATADQVRAERVPDLNVRVAAGQRADDGHGIVEAGLGMTVPIWDNRDGDVLAARFEVVRAQQQALAIQAELDRELHAAYTDFESARARHTEMSAQLLPEARRALDMQMTAYRAGNISFLELLDAQRTFIDARIEEITLRQQINNSLGRIHRIVGRPSISPSSDPTTAPAEQRN